VSASVTGSGWAPIRGATTSPVYRLERSKAVVIGPDPL
jgi:hypothetical protein